MVFGAACQDRYTFNTVGHPTTALFLMEMESVSADFFRVEFTKLLGGIVNRPLNGIASGAWQQKFGIDFSGEECRRTRKEFAVCTLLHLLNKQVF